MCLVIVPYFADGAIVTRAQGYTYQCPSRRLSRQGKPSEAVPVARRRSETPSKPEHLTGRQIHGGFDTAAKPARKSSSSPCLLNRLIGHGFCLISCVRQSRFPRNRTRGSGCTVVTLASGWTHQQNVTTYHHPLNLLNLFNLRINKEDSPTPHSRIRKYGSNTNLTTHTPPAPVRRGRGRCRPAR